MQLFPKTNYEFCCTLNFGDVQIVTNFCQVCQTNSGNDHQCNQNYEGASGGMEVSSAVNIFARFKDARGDVKYLGDGDSKAYIKCCMFRVIRYK